MKQYFGGGSMAEQFVPGGPLLKTPLKKGLKMNSGLSGTRNLTSATPVQSSISCLPGQMGFGHYVGL